MTRLSCVIFLCLTSVLSPALFAENAPYVDLRPATFRAYTTEIISPTEIGLVTTRRGYNEEFVLTLADIKPGNSAEGFCKRPNQAHHHHKSIGSEFKRQANEQTPELKHICKILRKTLLNKKVGVEIIQWEHPMRGYLSEQDTVINFDLISRGEYQVDYSQSRSAHLVRLEKKARCERLGSWEVFMGNKIEEMKCQD